MADIKERARSFLHRVFPASSGLVRQAEGKTADYQKRQREQIAMIDEPTNGRDGVDAGELGKKWDDTFK